uniref:Reverse transcriptase zinc-binding domain-containing protein n=1 Tax=Lactuca sativa TaxID=4236 RepID=A0A9R1VWR1_LACSA|nr:hypothetical protein LSAT_V11C400177480 [Lactuca sativa]
MGTNGYGHTQSPQKPHDYLCKKSITGVWKNIVGMVKDIEAHEQTLFWQDTWLGHERLKSKYLSLYELESNKRCTVADRSCLISAGLSTELQNLSNETVSCHLGDGPDRWQCLLAPYGYLMVRTLRGRIDFFALQSATLPRISWCKIVPLKVLCFIWRVAQGSILAATTLQQRGVTINITTCSNYADYILFNFPFVGLIRERIFTWCRINQHVVIFFNSRLHGEDAPN